MVCLNNLSRFSHSHRFQAFNQQYVHLQVPLMRCGQDNLKIRTFLSTILQSNWIPVLSQYRPWHRRFTDVKNGNDQIILDPVRIAQHKEYSNITSINAMPWDKLWNICLVYAVWTIYVGCGFDLVYVRSHTRSYARTHFSSITNRKALLKCNYHYIILVIQ